MAFLLKDYTDIQEIARGGMGKVYLATQVSLNRKVIIKEMASGLLINKTEIKRFENEARAAAALDHDNIIRIYDFGEDRGSFYIAMEYIDGPDLDSILKDRNYLPEIGLMIALFALKGLSHAHAHRIIHRDIKPGNILISKAGAVKVVDFGLAHAGSAQLHLTASDVIVGTPLFMSPEQATGEEKKDLRMDVWSVGVLLYRIITGTYPFQGENVPAILFQIVHSIEKPIQEVLPALPKDLTGTIGACLIKDRTERLSNLAPLIESLQNYFYEIGIKDIAEEIRRFVGDPAASAKALSRQLVEYHQRKAELYQAEGNQEQAQAHMQHAKRYDPLYKPIIRVIDTIKKHTSSSLINKTTAVGSTSGVGAWQPVPRKRLSVVAVLLSSMAVIVFGAAIVLFVHFAGKPAGVLTAAAIAKSDRSPSPGDAQHNPTRGDSAFKAGTLKTNDSAGLLNRPDTLRNETNLSVSLTRSRLMGTSSKIRKNTEQQIRSESSQSGIMKITVMPLNAEVRIDGEKKTAQEMKEGIRLITGLHQIDAMANGYEPYSKAVTVEKDAVQIITIDLIPEKPGMSSLHIHSYPWAEIFIDGEFKGNSPTAKPLALPEGTHTIVLQRAGFKTYKETVAIKKGELKKIKVTLTRG